jgi:hypothetical protein
MIQQPPCFHIESTRPLEIPIGNVDRVYYNYNTENRVILDLSPNISPQNEQ